LYIDGVCSTSIPEPGEQFGGVVIVDLLGAFLAVLVSAGEPIAECDSVTSKETDLFVISFSEVDSRLDISVIGVRTFPVRL
jgi:hypothetical protein